MSDFRNDPEYLLLLQEFVDSLVAREQELRKILVELRSLGSDELACASDLGTRIRYLTHNLAGAAASYGFKSLTVVSGRIDDELSVTAEVSIAALIGVSELLCGLLETAVRSGKNPEIGSFSAGPFKF